MRQTPAAAAARAAELLRRCLRMTSTARVLPASAGPPRCRASAPASCRGLRRRSGRSTFCAIASLTRARFTMHSRSTAPCTWLELGVVGRGCPAPAPRRAAGSCRRARSSRRSSTLISVAAMSHQRRFVRGRACRATMSCRPLGLALHACRAARRGRARRACRRSCSACSTCGASSSRLRAAPAHEDVEHVLDLAEVLA